MSRATESQLDAIHAQVSDYIADELTNAKARADAKPDDPASAISPQLLDKAMKWLAMNGVSAPATTKRIENVAAKLAELNLDDEVLGELRPN